MIRIDTSKSDESLKVTILGAEYDLFDQNDAIFTLMFEMSVVISDD